MKLYNRILLLPTLHLIWSYNFVIVSLHYYIKRIWELRGQVDQILGHALYFSPPSL